MRIISILSILLICACTRTADKDSKTNLTLSEINIKKEIRIAHPDTSLTRHSSSKVTIKNNRFTKHKKKKYPYNRMGELPGNDHFNGLPLIQELDLASIVLKNFPDTLKYLAKSSYSSFERFFPKSIQDNFEEGISTERTYYPRLIFKFQIFENEYSAKPYLEKLITIKKEKDGKLTAE